MPLEIKPKTAVTPNGGLYRIQGSNTRAMTKENFESLMREMRQARVASLAWSEILFVNEPGIAITRKAGVEFLDSLLKGEVPEIIFPTICVRAEEDDHEEEK